MKAVQGEAIGTMDTRIKIQYAVEAQDETGAAVTTWTDLASVWAAKDYKSGLEREDSEKTTAFTYVYYRVRHRADVTPKMRVLDGSTIYDIEAILDYPGRRSYQEFSCVQFEV